mmetsp:Transcript_8978/g.8017  ORF Transcript_8978/g.8017 Transcript_8978/m.8017 type:complete len:406 (+) Transcript_8978:12-1229(+)
MVNNNKNNNNKHIKSSEWITVLNNDQTEKLINPELGDWRKICWLHYPNVDWDIGWYFTIRGAESLHLYLWVLKDLSWTQDWFVCGHIFGILAVLWSCFLLYRAYEYRNIKEFWTNIGQFLWLFANLWWMSGELHDFSYPQSEKWYDKRTIEAGYIMETALIWLAIYYLFIKPFHILPPTKESEKMYDDTGLNPRFSFLFATWREYENIHILFWLGKDYGWNKLNPVIWILFLIPTVLIAVDFVLISLFQKNLLIEHCHYIAQVFWVIGNLLWAYGEIYHPIYDYPYDLFSKSPNRFKTFRWYSSWTLLLAYIPLIILYITWYRKDYKESNHLDQANHRSNDYGKKTIITETTNNPILVHKESPVKYQDNGYGTISSNDHSTDQTNGHQTTNEISVFVDIEDDSTS